MAKEITIDLTDQQVIQLAQLQMHILQVSRRNTDLAIFSANDRRILKTILKKALARKDLHFRIDVADKCGCTLTNFEDIIYG
jgi:hypothetical protein